MSHLDSLARALLDGARQEETMRHLALIATLLASSIAAAGYRSYNPVQIDTVNRRAYGSLGDARASSDSHSYVSIEFVASPSGVGAFVEFNDAANHYAQCSTSNASMLQALATAKSDSYLSVAWDTGGLCTYVSVQTTSWAPPKQP